MRLRWRDLGGGLYLSGPREDQPPTTLRRAIGLHNIPTASLRSRAGSTLLYTLDAHSLVRFHDHRLQGVGTGLYLDGSAYATGFNGARLSFIKTPLPTTVDSYLLVSGGGVLKKIGPGLTGADITNIGIDPPPDGVVATKIAANVKIINDCEATGSATTWLTASGTTLTSLATDATIFTTGTKSTKMVVPKDDGASNGVGGIECVPASTLDLSTFASGTSPLDSPDEDWIGVDLRFNRPRRVDSITIQFDVGDGGYNDVYQREIVMDDHVTLQVPFRPKGLADLAEVSGNELLFLSSAVSIPFKLNAHELMGKTKASPEDDSWASLLIPKSSFIRVGSGTGTWANVDKYKITVRANTNGNATCYVDNLRMLGGFGLQGTYQYLFTFLNDTTGTRSNSNPTPVTLADVFRQPVSLTNLPVSADPQVTHVEIWRTVGGGEAFFYVDKVTNGTTTYTDIFADYDGLHSLTSNVLTPTVLLTDNIVPRSTFERSALHQGRVFWTDANSGKLYYSPEGRPEVAADFLTVTTDEEPLTGLATLAGRLFVSSEARWFEILGTDAPFLVAEVLYAPGCVQPFTIVSTPYGIVYQSQDGIRRLDGSLAELLGFEALGPVLRGETVSDIAGFVGVVATYARGEYVVSDGTVTLAYHLQQGRWRVLGIGAAAFCYEPDTNVLQVSTGSQVLDFEPTTNPLDDAGTAIPVDWETGGLLVGGGQPRLVQRVYVDLLTQNQTLIPTLILDDGTTYTLPAATAPTRRVIVYPVLQQTTSIGLRLTGSLTQPVQVFGIEAEVHAEPTLA